jgi:hypothetical protein
MHDALLVMNIRGVKEREIMINRFFASRMNFFKVGFIENNFLCIPWEEEGEKCSRHLEELIQFMCI